MGLKGQRKCCVCEKFFPGDIVYTIDAKTYCPDCGERLKKGRMKEITVNRDLNDYIYKLAGYDRDVMPFWGKQIRALKEENGWKAESILATLKYAFEIRQLPPIENPEYGIAWVVERYFSAAKKYHEELRDLAKTPEEEIQEILLAPPQEILLKRSEIMKRDNRFLEKTKNLTYGPELDMDDIIDDEEFYGEEEVE